mmetsp:Transcript_130511/g.317030  ORF Transcript_130511/g.317030 Transcript_130511/m.317030 type:complete len:195 (-) Transcript_130511:431-1015(-)
MMQSMGRAVPCMLPLLLVLGPCSSAADAPPCADYPNLVMVVELATTCFDACQEACSPLSEAVALSLSGGDPLPVVCARQDTLACITGLGNRNICGEMLQTANSMGIAVPRTTEAMQAVCLAAANRTDTNTTTTAAANLTDTTTTTTAANQTDTNTTTTTTPQVSKTSSVASCAGVWVLLVAAAVARGGPGPDSR